MAHSKLKHYNPADPEEHLPDTSAVDNDNNQIKHNEVGLVWVIAVKVQTTCFESYLLTANFCKCRHTHLQRKWSYSNTSASRQCPPAATWHACMVVFYFCHATVSGRLLWGELCIFSTFPSSNDNQVLVSVHWHFHIWDVLTRTKTQKMQENWCIEAQGWCQFIGVLVDMWHICRKSGHIRVTPRDQVAFALSYMKL